MRDQQRRSCTRRPGFLLPFRLPALASWVILRPLGSWTFLTVGLPDTGRAGPHRGCHVAHAQDATGQGAPLTPGTVVRSRLTNTLQPAPAASQRPVPTAPLAHPIGGVTVTRHQRGFTCVRPSHRAAMRLPGAGEALPRSPGGLLLAGSSRMGREPLGFFLELRTPQLPAAHVEAETGHRALARVLHPRHQPNLHRCLPLALMHPHVARTGRLPPSPPGSHPPPAASRPVPPGWR